MDVSDLGAPIEVAEGIYWLGFFDEESKLNSNPFLIVEEGEAVLIDPGSIPDFPVVMRKIIDLIRPDLISTIVVAHQDPDVCGNLPVVEDIIRRDDLQIAAHSISHQLIYHYGIRSRLYPVDHNDYELTLKSGRKLQFLRTPYLHSPGAIVTYDTKSKVLFSSDLFGSLTKAKGLYAGDDFPQSMDRWHQDIMPSNRLLRGGLRVIEKLDLEQILPQHGSLIPKERIREAIAHLDALPCGYDLLEPE